MSKTAFNGNMFHDGRQAIITHNDAIQRVIQGFQRDGQLNFGSGALGEDTLIFIAVGKQRDIADLILRAGLLRTGTPIVVKP